MGSSDVAWIDAEFLYCVRLLVKNAKSLGISYKVQNIWVFINI